MRNLLVILLLLCTNFVFGQDYSYKYNGALSEDNKPLLEKKITDLTGFHSVKIRVKENSGLVLFSIATTNSEKEVESTASLSDIKSLLIEFGLEPDNLQQIEK